MTNVNEKNIIRTLGKRAELSVQGKAIIGIASIFLMLIAYIIKGGDQKSKEFISFLDKKEEWLENYILNPIVNLNSEKKICLFIKVWPIRE